MRLSLRKPLTQMNPNVSLQRRRVNDLEKFMSAIRAQNVEQAENLYHKSPALIDRVSTPILCGQNFAMYLWLEPKIKDKWTLLNCAIDVRNKVVVTDLLQKYPNLLNSVHKEIEAGNLKLVEKLCEIQVLPTDAEGNTFLHIAASAGQSEIVRLLVAKFPQLDIQNRSDLFPIDLAVLCNSKESVELLVPKYLTIERGLIENGETTPLILAIERHSSEIVATLVKAGVDLCSIIEGVRTPFLLALSNQNFEMMDLILQWGGAKALGPDIAGSSPTHYAASMNFMKGLEFLQKCNLLDLTSNKEGDTPVDLALWNENATEEVFRFLWKKELKLEEIDDLGATRLHRIVERGFIRSLEEIILKEKNSTDSYLEYIQDRELGFQSQIRKKDRIWVRDENGDTLFHTAARTGHLEALQILYSYDPKFYEAHNEEGKSGIELMNLGLKAEFTNWLIFQR
ncbi:MAG: hypothetical protein ChlgKO_08230 [Chlamydiales bacterium]